MKKLIAVLLALSTAALMSACGKKDPAETTTEAPSSEMTTLPALPEETTAEILTTETTAAETTTAEQTTVPVTEQTTAQPATEAPTSAAPATEAPTEAPTAPAQASAAEIVQTFADAVNKTKGYTSAITVNHKESFNIVEPVVKLDSAEALGNLATKAVNFVKDLVLKPSSEVYNFNNGMATTSEGEKTQLLLPKDKAFGITADAVASASMTEENGMKHIKLTLNPEETHSLSEVPVNHSNSIGYLDIDGSFKIIQIDSITIKYPGSTIDAYIREDGYVASATYVINLEAEAKAHGMGISGSSTFSGSQTEEWVINW